jgi:D-serine deaminase-like pyridoxal phosphate-dependent protein
MHSTTTQSGGLVGELDTPATLVDLDRLEANIRDWQAVMDRHGVAFRPHVKTHKIPEIARMQIAAGARGIVCAKVSEAEPFADAGVRDICLAYPVFGAPKWQRIARLAARGVRMTVNCDNEEAARGIAAGAVAAGAVVNLQIDVDSGLHRGGIPASDVAAIERLSRVIMELPGVTFDGVTTFRSSGFEGAPAALADAGHDEGRTIVAVAEHLRRSGIEVREVTAGSTPTGRFVAEVPGVTEVHSGTYALNDLMQLGLGVAAEDRLALSVLCTVVSHMAPERLTIDAGSKTFSGDFGGFGPGLSAPAIARAVDRPIVVERLSEEHGMARVEAGAHAELGEKIRFVPYHACTCVNMTDEIVGVRGDRVEVVWPVRARGLRQ